VQPFQSSIDSILSPVCESFHFRADDILNLRHNASRRVLPGQCISCYFKLYGAADSNSVVANISALGPLREWLESNIEVIATDGTERVIEQLPLCLEASDLEAYCREVMDEFRENRVYSASLVTLEFRYKKAA
jgi:hypothetical protein